VASDYPPRPSRKTANSMAPARRTEMDSGHHQRSRTTLGLSESSHYRERPLNLITIAQRDPSRLSEDLPSETERPRSSCAGTTDTDRFAEYKSASRGKFGRSSSACRIENKSEQKRAAGFPFVQPFERPAATTDSTRAGAEDAMELAVDNGGFILSALHPAAWIFFPAIH
jgi:hypothetical protein